MQRLFCGGSQGLFVVVGLFLSSFAATAASLDQAPPSFAYERGKAVAMDIKSIQLNLTFDVRAAKTKGQATINFVTAEEGFPFFDLVPNITAAQLNGEAVDPQDIPTVADPDNVTKVRVLKRNLAADETHQLDVEYDLSTGVEYAAGVAKVGFFMSDLTVGGRAFWEQYGPANYEYDQFQQTINVRIINTDKEHTIYTNAEMTQMGAAEWELVFPDYFTTSSFYLHIAAKNRFVEKTAVYQGKLREIPVLSYAESANNATRGLRDALAVLAENEETFGPYAHAKAIAYITPDGGGMEYGGATMTSIWALEHEFTHFWFARGVMPANGNAGWIDEAVASWRDNGYPRASTGPTGSPHNLGGFSPFRRHTTRDAYTLGAGLISEFDRQFASFNHEGKSGMRGVLRALFAERQRTTITVEFFKEFMERVTGADLTNTFERYVYGHRASDDEGIVDDEAKMAPAGSSKHPRPYTQAELNLYR